MQHQNLPGRALSPLPIFWLTIWKNNHLWSMVWWSAALIRVCAFTKVSWYSRTRGDCGNLPIFSYSGYLPHPCPCDNLSHNVNCNFVCWPSKMCAHPKSPILKSHVTDCYVAVVVTTTHTYKYQPANPGIMLRKRRNKTPDDNSECCNERGSSHVVTTVTHILLFI